MMGLVFSHICFNQEIVIHLLIVPRVLFQPCYRYLMVFLLEDNILCQNFAEVYFNCGQVYHDMHLHGILNNFRLLQKSRRELFFKT